MNLILCGMPCSGKTHYGKILAHALGKDFIDTDELIMSHYFSRYQINATCREIVLKEGDGFFRQLEEDVIKKLEGIILETAVQDNKVIQDFELESLSMGTEHSQKVKAVPIESDYGSKDCVNLLSSTAASRIKETIIALGGGVLGNVKNINRLKSLGCLVYLKVPRNVLLERIKLRDPLPSMFDKDRLEESFDELLQQRLPDYERHCDWMVDTANENVIEILKNYACKGQYHGS